MNISIEYAIDNLHVLNNIAAYENDTQTKTGSYWQEVNMPFL